MYTVPVCFAVFSAVARLLWQPATTRCPAWQFICTSPHGHAFEVTAGTTDANVDAQAPDGAKAVWHAGRGWQAECSGQMLPPVCQQWDFPQMLAFGMDHIEAVCCMFCIGHCVSLQHEKLALAAPHLLPAGSCGCLLRPAGSIPEPLQNVLSGLPCTRSSMHGGSQPCHAAHTLELLGFPLCRNACSKPGFAGGAVRHKSNTVAQASGG